MRLCHVPKVVPFHGAESDLTHFSILGGIGCHLLVPLSVPSVSIVVM